MPPGSREVEVAAGLLVRGDRVLVAQRRRDDARGGLWEFPGGTLEPGESVEECLARELREELGIEVRVGELLLSTTHEEPDLRIHLRVHRVELVRGEPALLEHSALAWLLPEELGEIPLSPADRPVVEWLLARRGGART